MYQKFGIVIAFVIGIGMVGCTSGDTSRSTIDNTSTSGSITVAQSITQPSKSQTKTSPSTKPLETKLVTQPLTTTTPAEETVLYSNAIIEYSVPKDWRENASEDDLKYYYPEVGMLMVSYDEDFLSINNEPDRIKYLEGIATSVENFELLSEIEINVAGSNGYQIESTMELSGVKYETSIVTFDFRDGTISLWMTKPKDSTFDYREAFDRILKSVEFTDEQYAEALEPSNEAEEIEQKMIRIALGFEPKLKVKKPDSLGNIYVEATVMNTTNFPLTYFEWTFKDRNSSEKHYLSTYDTIMPGEKSTKMETFGPESGNVDDMDPLTVKFKVRFDKETTLTVSYDYKLQEISYYE